MENEIASLRPALENWFPYTKVQPPQPGHNHVARDRLQRTLAGAVRDHKLTLVAAPAGSGKTVLCASLAHSDMPAAWVTLDETDNDLPLFVALLATALRPWMRDDGRSLLAFLQAASNLSEKTGLLTSHLINSLEVEGDDPHVLILDDYQAIDEPTIHELVAHLLDYLPPALHILIATRHDPPLPLARWRARSQLAEVRLPELRFDGEETAIFLNQRHDLGLSPTHVDTLQQQTGGWAAGLQLLAAVLATFEDVKQRADYIGHLVPGNRSIVELLTSEVLAHQPPEIQDFLRQTSILPELTPTNCRAVTKNADAPQLLQDVYRRNLFLRALTPDTHAGPFRYHDLFRDFLQQQLKEEQPQRWIELHRRAAQTAGSDEQRLYHLTSAALWEEAVQLLEEMAQMDSERRFTRYSVVSGIENLPDDVRREHPWLLLFVAQHYAIRGQVDEAAPWRAQAAARFQETGDEAGQVELLAIGAMVDTGDTESLVSAFRDKVKTAKHLMRPDHWAVYHGLEQWHAIARCEWRAVAEHTQANIRRALSGGDIGVLTMTSLTIGPQMLFGAKGMPVIEDFATRALRAAGAEDWILQLCARGLLGAIRFFQGRLDEAEDVSREAHDLLQEIGGLAWIDHHICWVILALALARRAYHGFDELLETQASRWKMQDTAVAYQQGMWYLQGRSFWLRKRTVEAQEILQQMQRHAGQSSYPTEDEERRRLLAALVAMARGDTGEAKRELMRAIELHDRVRHTVMLSHPRLTLATLYGQQNRWTEAMVEFEHVLNELKARRMPGVILQEGESIAPVLQHAIEQDVERDLLEPFLHVLQPEDGARRIALPHSSEYLTPRQGEVLRLLATGATNPEIAAQLSITERTVKAHVSRILAKLEAATRTEAVSKALELGLI